MNVGNTYKLKVVRMSEIGYILYDKKSDKEVLMHFKDATKEYKLDDVVKVFIYMDHQKRVCATDYTSLINEDEVAFLEIVDHNPKIGFFLDMGIRKQLLLGNDDLPSKEFFPQIGDKVLVRLKVAKSGMFAKLIKKDDIHQYFQPKGELTVGEKYKARIITLGNAGLNLLTEDHNSIFVYRLHTRNNHRLGEELEVKIINDNHGDYNGTLIEQKENMISQDSERILQVIIDNDGVINFDAKSDADDIFKKFRMSKKAFKNALGSLYKARKVYFEEGKTILVK